MRLAAHPVLLVAHRRGARIIGATEMKLRVASPLLAATLAALGPNLFAPPANPWRVFKQSDGLAENACVSVTVGAGGHVLVRHPNSDAISLLDGYEITTVPGPPGNPNRVYESPSGQLWTVAPQGLLEFREGAWLPHPVPQIPRQLQTGDTNPIPLLPVRHGRVLILLRDQLLQFKAENSGDDRIQTVRRAEGTSLGEFQNMTPSRDGGLWVAGTNAVAKVAGSLRNLKASDAWVLAEELPPELSHPPPELLASGPVAGHRILDVATEADGVLWLATSAGLIRRAPAIWEAAPGLGAPGAADRSIVETIRRRAGAALDDEVAQGVWTCGLVARNGDFWLGGTNVIAWLHKNTWRVFSSTNQIGPEQVLAFVETPDARIYCATPDKLWEFDGRNWLVLRGGFEHVNTLCCARNGTLWVASNAGVYRCVRGAWLQNDVADGLPSTVVTGVREDESGRILATTAAGVSAFQPEADSDAPRTTIRPLAEKERSVREGALIRLVFSGRDKWNVTMPERLLFSHRLDENEWSPFEETTEAIFPELPVGKHYFQARAMDRNANVEPRPARLEFTVVAPWYRETRLVLILTVALAVAIFFAALAFNRHRKLRLSYAEVERKVAERTRELEHANRELLHSQKMTALGTLAAGVAHDFNNILSIVKGSAQIIEDNPGNAEKIRTRVERIKTVVQQGAGIVHALLGFSRSSDEQPARCDLNAVVDDTIKLLGDRFLREIEIQFDHAPDLPEVAAAKDLIQQILLNFVFNAAESMNHPKRVVLGTRRLDTLPVSLVLKPAPAVGYVSISVRDFGHGIPPEILPRIFEPFFTTKALSTRRGTGLGLSMVYELAKKMDAGLAVETAVGEGSTFMLILPARGDTV